jgi:3-deoxy-7-phosphoheptulonate synthase
MRSTHQVHVASVEPLIPPGEMSRRFPMTERANETVVAAREGIQRILSGADERLLVVVGPCSIHDEKAAMEYAGRLADLARRVADRLLIVMRVYFEKPRTTVGWKGLINDPHLNGTFDIGEGLGWARRILLAVNEVGLPAATEMLDPISPQYTADLVAWASIGARTTESQTHRQMASGLSMPIGFKNSTDGNLQNAVDAMAAAREPHSFLGIDFEGRTCIINTAGNSDGHLILRGGHSGPNYDAEHVARAAALLEKAGLCPSLMIDCSHANSGKDHRRQAAVLRDALAQRAAGNKNVIGVMIESNLREGSQKIAADLAQLKYGVSITDACIGWEETERLLSEAHASILPGSAGETRAIRK